MMTPEVVNTLIEQYFRSKLGGGIHHERHAIVTSFDPERYLAKVMYMPEGQTSGWLPIETAHIGADYGMAIGLQPGDGKTTGDQVIVRFQEGDLESGKIVQRVHSNDDKPPTVQSGEMVLWTKFKKSAGQQGPSDNTTDTGSGNDNDAAQGGQGGTGAQIYFKNDGSVTWTDGNGGTHAFDGHGNYTLTCNNHTMTVNGNHSVTVTGNRSLSIKGSDGVSIGGSVSKSVGGGRSDAVKGSWVTSAAASLWSWLNIGGHDDDG